MRPGRSVIVCVLLVSSPAAAHQPGLSQGAYRVDGRRVAAELVLARGEAAQLVPRVDADRDGALSEVELLQVQDALAEALAAGVQVQDGATACPGAVDRVAFVEEDGLSFSTTFTCPPGQPLAALTIRLPLLARLAGGHRHVARVWFTGASADPQGLADPVDIVLQRRRPALTIRRPTRTGSPAPEPSPPAPSVEEPTRSPWRTWAGVAGLLGLLGLLALRLRGVRRRRA